MAERVIDLLAKNPTLRVADLMKAVGCSRPTASKARLAYFAAHPEREVPAEQAEKNA
jgi:hypothetical protein